jgi:hypothetical protein
MKTALIGTSCAARELAAKSENRLQKIEKDRNQIKEL